MRTLMASLLVTVGVVVGYALGTAPTNAYAQVDDWLPFNKGAMVRLSVDLPEGAIACKVSQVQNGFIACARDDQQRQLNRWINLRFVKEITPRPER